MFGVNVFALFCIFGYVVQTTFSQVQEGTPCVTPTQQFGTCKSIKSCETLLNLLRTQSQNPEVVNYLRGSVCGYMKNIPMVCCPQKLSRFNEQPTPVETSTIESPKENLPPLPKPPDCGFSNVSIPRVVGGIPAKLGEFPWAVTLGYQNKNNPSLPKWLCGGSLITEKHILTAAHCVHNRNDLYIARVGDLDLYDDNEGADPEDIPLVKAKIHEDYSSSQFTNDIAILTLARKPRNLSAGVYPVCLPWEDQLRSETFVKKTGTVAGWGALYFNGPNSNTLQLVQLPVVSNDNCKRAFGNRTVIDDRIICAGYLAGGKDSCKGDSGGPLMWGTLEQTSKAYLRFYQIGVVSYGFRCAEAGYPGVYTRVTHFIDWIRRNLD